MELKIVGRGLSRRSDVAKADALTRRSARVTTQKRHFMFVTPVEPPGRGRLSQNPSNLRLCRELCRELCRKGSNTEFHPTKDLDKVPDKGAE